MHCESPAYIFSNLSSITEKLEAASQVMMGIIRNTVAHVEQHLHHEISPGHTGQHIPLSLEGFLQ